MSRVFAIIENGVVANAIVADAWPDGIDVTDLSPRPGPGWLFDGSAFSPPAPVEPEIETTPLMTHFAWLSRLTLEEHVSIEEAMPSSPLLRVAKQRFDAAREVDVSLPEVQQFVGVLVQMQLLAAERAPDLLAPKPLTERGAIHPTTHEITP